MTRTTSTLTIVTFRVVEETDDEKQPPSLPPFPIDTEGTTVSEAIGPLAKVLPLVKLRRLGS